jgi:pimeloyl-ACP methyl ester carboxylesterase
MTRLVFLPGLACDARLWHAQQAAVAPAFHPVVSDVHMRHDGIEAMARALLAEHDGTLVLCGASMGGMIAMEAARQAPDRIAGLALLGTSPRPETPEMFRLRESAIGLFERGEARELIEFNANFAFHPAQAADKALVRRYVEMVLDLGALRCPVLVLCGDTDRLTPPECSREIAERVAHAELRWIPSCGHMLTMEKPALVNVALSDWLARLGTD